MAPGDPTKRTHREYVEHKQNDVIRPTPTPLTEQLILENTLEQPEKVKVLEMLFTSLADMPGLQACGKLQELTLMHARLTRMPNELQLVRGTLRRLSLANNEIRQIEHLEGMAKLHSLFLHDNRIAAFTGLEGCPGLQRLWLSQNEITSAASLPAAHLGELRELWLGANPIESVDGLPALRNLQVLSLAGTRIRSLEQLAPLVKVAGLFDLAFSDNYYGSAPIVDEPSYHAAALRSLKQLGVLDGRTIVERQRSDAEEEFLQRSLRFNVEVDRLKKDAASVLAALDRERQSSAAGLRSLRTAHSRSVAQLHALVTAGQEEMRKQEEGFLAAHAGSRAELRSVITQLKLEYNAEVERIAAAETERIHVCRRRLALLKSRSDALAATRQAVATAEMAGEGRLYAEPVERSDPQYAFVRARAEAEPLIQAKKDHGSTIHMLACYRLYRVPASAAAAAATDSRLRHAAALSHNPSLSRGTWWWCCATLPSLLEAAARFSADANGNSSSNAPRAASDVPMSNWGVRLWTALSVDDSVGIDTSTVPTPKAPSLSQAAAAAAAKKGGVSKGGKPAAKTFNLNEGNGEEDYDDEEDDEEEPVAASASHEEDGGVVDITDGAGDGNGNHNIIQRDDGAIVCAAVLCRSAHDVRSHDAPAGAYAGSLAGSGVPSGPSQSELITSAAAAQPEYLVIYEVYPPGVEFRSLLADCNDLVSFQLNNGSSGATNGGSSANLIGPPASAEPQSKKGKKKAAAEKAAAAAERLSSTEDVLSEASTVQRENSSGNSNSSNTLPLINLPALNDHQLLEALLSGEMLPPHQMQMPLTTPPPKGTTTATTAGATTGRSSPDDPSADAAAIAKAAAEEEAAAVQAAVARAQRNSAKQASEHAVLLQLERRVDEAFRAHEYRVWKAAHPSTATALERTTDRIRQLQTQLGSTYEQIRQEHAQQLRLRAQIEARSGNAHAAAEKRAETLMEQALKAAKLSIKASAADEGDGA